MKEAHAQAPAHRPLRLLAPIKALGLATVHAALVLSPQGSFAYLNWGSDIQAAICGPSVQGGPINTCTPQSILSRCPASWINSGRSTFLFTYTMYWNNGQLLGFGNSLAEACTLAAPILSQMGAPGSTTEFLGDTEGCKQSSADQYGNVATTILNGYWVCFPSGAMPLPPFSLAAPPLGCAYGAGGFQRCPGNSPQSPNAQIPPGTPAGGGLSPNIGVPGPDSSPGPDGTDGATTNPQDWLAGSTCANPDRTQSTDASGTGDPIFGGSGNNFYQERDFIGPRGLSLIRTYNSSLPGWTHNWNLRVIADSTTALVVRHDGRAHKFTGNGPGAWVPEPGTREQLIQLTSIDASQPHWQYTSADDAQELYDPQGNLLSVTLRGGFTYTALRSGGLLSDIVDPYGRKLHFAYAADNTLYRVYAPDGAAITYSYDAKGKLIAASFPDGRSNQYLYESANYPLALTGVVDGRGVRVSSWAYDSAGRAVSNTAAGGVGGYQLTYGADGSASITDPLGTTRKQSYAAAGARKLFAGQSRPCASCTGDAAIKTFDSEGLLGQRTDYLGVTTLFTNDNQRKLPVAITRAAGMPEQQQTSVQWHASFRVPVLVTQPGRSTSFGYDALGNMLTRTVADTATGDARTWNWSYNAQGLPIAMTEPDGGQWAYAYDNQGNLVAVTDPLARKTQFSYDASGRVLSRTEPNGLVISYAYDARGRPVRMTRDGEITQYGYTAAGQLQAVYMPAQYAYVLAYDNAQRLLSITDTRGPVLTYERDNMGNPVRETLTYGNTVIQTTRSFDALGRMVTATGGEGRMSIFTYNANGVVTGVARYDESLGIQLDALGRLVVMTTADGAQEQRHWNSLDQVTRVSDPKGVSTAYATNAFGEVINENGTDAGMRKYERDSAGRITATTDARGNRVTISRDALGRPQQVAAASQSRSFAYDSGGFISGIEDKAGSTAFTRDLQGRVLSKTQLVNDNTSSPSQFKVSYGYVSGALTDITYPSGLLVHYVRQSNWITGIQIQEPGGTARRPKPWVIFVNDVAYTAWNQPQSWKWNSGDKANRSFDREGNMLANEFASYRYDAAGRMNGITQNLSYAIAPADGAKQLGTTPFSWSVGYDNRGRIVAFARDGASSAFSYDANSNRLTSVETTTSDTDLNGEFDAADLSKTESRLLTVDAGSNRLLGFQYSATVTNKGKSRSTASSTIAYALDANGSMVSDGLRTFDYDEFNRLAKVRAFKDGRAAIVSYLTNALGQRVFKSELSAEESTPDASVLGDGFVAWLKRQFGWMFTHAQATSRIGTAYVYGDGEVPPWALLGEYDNGSASGKGRTEYIWLPTVDGGAIPIGLYRGGRLYAIHTDHLGTPRLMTNDGNVPVWQWPYSAFGTTKPTGVLATTRSPKVAITVQPVLLRVTAATELNLRYPGQYFDEELGTFYNMHRDSMDPAAGRYRQADPTGLAGGLNRFNYAEGAPLGKVDPLGLATYMCTQPLHALGAAGRLVYSPENNPLYHQFLAVIDPDGSVTTGGQDREKGLWGPGRPSEGDGVGGSGSACKKVEDDNRCIEMCLKDKFAQPRPNYSLFFAKMTGGQNCQAWSIDVLQQCQTQCMSKQ